MCYGRILTPVGSKDKEGYVIVLDVINKASLEVLSIKINVVLFSV